MKKFCFPFIALISVFASSCKSCKEPLEVDTNQVVIEPYAFYGQDYIGHYESDSTFSNGANVSAFVKVTLDLQPNDGKFLYKEKNPTLGTSFSEEMLMNGGFNLNKTLDTLLYRVHLGSYTYSETVWHDGGPDIGQYSTLEIKTVENFKDIKMPFKRVSPGKYILEREFNGTTQRYFLTKW